MPQSLSVGQAFLCKGPGLDALDAKNLLDRLSEQRRNLERERKTRIISAGLNRVHRSCHIVDGHIHVMEARREPNLFRFKFVLFIPTADNDAG